MQGTAQHAVAVARGCYVVTSVRSGNVYKVVPLGGAEAACQCERNRRTGQDCSHIEAVRRFAVLALEEAACASL